MFPGFGVIVFVGCLRLGLQLVGFRVLCSGFGVWGFGLLALGFYLQGLLCACGLVLLFFAGHQTRSTKPYRQHKQQNQLVSAAHPNRMQCVCVCCMCVCVLCVCCVCCMCVCVCCVCVLCVLCVLCVCVCVGCVGCVVCVLCVVCVVLCVCVVFGLCVV